MKLIYLSLALFSLHCCHADFSDHLKKDTTTRVKKSPIKHIDYIYLINLDQRPEKYAKCLAQLNPYKITPHRFSAIYGWDLTGQDINDLGVKFLPGMISNDWVHFFPTEGQCSPELEFLRKDLYGKNVFSRWMTPGAIGCTLSHLSVLQDAYDAGYQTIWVMEDDISIQKDPKLLTALIEKLDSSVGKNGWDILFTDLDTSDYPMYTAPNDFESDLKGDLWFFWRPDRDLSDRSSFAKRTIISDDFIKIGSRMRTHSMIIRRSGMKKILDYEKNHHMFIPYDHELAIVPDIQMFSLRYNLVTHDTYISDTQNGELSQKVNWQKFKQSVITELPQISGYHDFPKADKIMELIRELKPATCVEIGAFGGAITYPIASTLSFLKSGVVYAIDAWDIPTAIEGMNNEKAIQWWKNLNMQGIRQQLVDRIENKGLAKHCIPVHQLSKNAVAQFSENSIDFLYMDGSVSKSGSLEDTLLYFPKVKEGGYIWLNDADNANKKRAIVFLMENCTWIKEKSIGSNCLLFQKTTKDNK